MSRLYTCQVEIQILDEDRSQPENSFDDDMFNFEENCVESLNLVGFNLNSAGYSSKPNTILLCGECVLSGGKTSEEMHEEVKKMFAPRKVTTRWFCEDYHDWNDVLID